MYELLFEASCQRHVSLLSELWGFLMPHQSGDSTKVLAGFPASWSDFRVSNEQFVKFVKELTHFALLSAPYLFRRSSGSAGSCPIYVQVMDMLDWGDVPASR